MFEQVLKDVDKTVKASQELLKQLKKLEEKCKDMVNKAKKK